MSSVSFPFRFPSAVSLVTVVLLGGYIVYGRVIAKVPKGVDLPYFEALFTGCLCTWWISAILNFAGGHKPWWSLVVVSVVTALSVVRYIVFFSARSKGLNEAARGALIAGLLCIVAAGAYLLAWNSGQ